MAGEWTPERLDAVEQTVRTLTERVAALESALADRERPSGQADARGGVRPATAVTDAGETRRPPALEPSPARAGVPYPSRAPRRPALTEDLLAGKGLAWVGGAAVVLGIVFFLALAIRNGLISESLRVALAGLGSAALASGGVWLFEKKGQTQASLIAVGAGIAGAFATLVSATQQYRLIRPDVGLFLAGLVGAIAVAGAIRVRSREIAGLGVVGALLAPVLVDAGTSGASLVYVTIALLAASVVAVWRSWPVLSLIALLVTAPQLSAWATGETVGVTAGLVVTALFGLVHLATVVAHELVRPVTGTRLSTSAAASLNATLTSVVGLAVITSHNDHLGAAGNRWMLVLAAGHLLVGGALFLRAPKRLIGPLIAVLGFVLLAIAFAMLLGGPALVVAWSAQAVAAAWLAATLGTSPPLVGAGALLSAALAHVLAFEAPLTALRDGVTDLGDAWLGLGAFLAAAAAIWALTSRDLRAEFINEAPRVRSLLVGIGAAVGLYLASVTIVELVGPGAQRAQVVLSVVWGLVGLGAVVAGLLRRVTAVRLAGLSLLGLAMAKIVLYDLANLNSVSRAISFVVVGLIALSGAFAYQRIRAQVGPEASDGDSTDA